jgi:hypothetical protein
LCHAAALATGSLEHFALTATTATPTATGTFGLAGGAAIGAARRLVGESLLSVELLLARRENERTIAICAGQRFVLIHRASLLTHDSLSDSTRQYVNRNHAGFETL